MGNGLPDSAADFDVLVLGAGSAGYAAARVAGEMGARVGLVEGGSIGGLCILDGCMPSKALLQPAHLAQHLRSSAALGLRDSPGDLDFARVMARKRALVATFAADRREEIEDAPGVTLLRGRAHFTGPGEIALRPQGEAQGQQGEPQGEAQGERRYTAARFVIATGSHSSVPDVPGIEEVGYITSDQALDLDSPPADLVVIGGGAVALELGQFYARAGSRVTLLEQGPQLLSDADPDVSQALAGALRAEGITILTSTTVERCASAGAGRRRVRTTVAGEPRELVCDQLLVATGRPALVAGLQLDAAGIAVDRDGGFVAVDATQRTSNAAVYAAGDVATKRRMTHLAVLQGEVAGYNAAHDLGCRPRPAGDPEASPPIPSTAAQRLGGVARRGADGRLRLDTSVVPQVLFTDPAYARVGLGEREARRMGIAYDVARYDFADLGMAILMGETKGFVKLVARRDDGRILGAEVLGVQAETLIHEAVLALAFGVTADQLARLPHYHPTLSEIFALTAARLPQHRRFSEEDSQE